MGTIKWLEASRPYPMGKMPRLAPTRKEMAWALRRKALKQEQAAHVR